MTTLKVTLPTKKTGQLAIFTIEFPISNFNAVIDAVSDLKTFDDLNNCSLWKVI